jgi:hypothetical protein
MPKPFEIVRMRIAKFSCSCLWCVGWHSTVGRHEQLLAMRCIGQGCSGPLLLRPGRTHAREGLDKAYISNTICIVNKLCKLHLAISVAVSRVDT